MKIEQIYTGCLAQGAYYITSNGEAAIIDPLRETKPYMERLEKDGVKLKYIFETHFHADFVSGHLDLSKKTGASVVYGPNAKPDFEFISAKSLIGFFGEGEATAIDWQFLITISAFAIIGIFIGTALSKKIDGAKLKPAFGWFVLAMGIYIITKELFFS